jgi:tetratricopeptide (TPR) repeat protein
MADNLLPDGIEYNNQGGYSAGGKNFATYEEAMYHHNSSQSDAGDVFLEGIGGAIVGGAGKALANANAAGAARREENTTRWIEANNASQDIYNEAFGYYEAKEYDKAIETFHKTIKAAEGFGEYLGRSCVYIADIFLYQKNDYKQAIKYASYAVKHMEHENIYTGETIVKNSDIDYHDSWRAFAYFTRGVAYLKSMENQSNNEKEKTKKLAIEDFRDVLDYCNKEEGWYQQAAEHLKNLGAKFIGKRHPLLFNSLGGIAAGLFAYAFTRNFLVGFPGFFITIAGLIAGGITFFIVGYGIIGAFVKKLSVKLPLIATLFLLAIIQLKGNKIPFGILVLIAAVFIGIIAFLHIKAKKQT